jgi:hypothetical protein
MEKGEPTQATLYRGMLCGGGGGNQLQMLGIPGAWASGVCRANVAAVVPFQCRCLLLLLVQSSQTGIPLPTTASAAIWRLLVNGSAPLWRLGRCELGRLKSGGRQLRLLLLLLMLLEQGQVEELLLLDLGLLLLLLLLLDNRGLLGRCNGCLLLCLLLLLGQQQSSGRWRLLLEHGQLLGDGRLQVLDGRSSSEALL